MKNIYQRQATMKHLHTIVEDLALQLLPIKISGSGKPIDVSTPRRRDAFVEKQLKHAREGFKDAADTYEGRRFATALAIYQVIFASLSHAERPQISFSGDIQLCIRLLPSFDDRRLFLFVDEQLVYDALLAYL